MSGTGLLRITALLLAVALLPSCKGGGGSGRSAASTSQGSGAPLAANASGGVIELSWNPGSGVSTGYYVEQSTDGVNWRHILTVTSASATITGATYGQRYRFRVRAYNQAGTSPYSGVATVTP